jgi:CheY-like chemotaxis protein
MSNAILIADDNEDDAYVTAKVLQDAGVRNPVRTVADGDEVFAYFNGDNQYADREQFPLPGILLLDMKMARFGGFEVMQWLGERQLMKDVLVVLLTGHRELDNQRLAYQFGARSCLAKPFNVAEVKKLVQSFPEYWETNAEQAVTEGNR